jgi:hypothetical protein
MSERTARHMSWSITVFSVLLVMVGLVINALALVAIGQVSKKQLD